MKAPPNNLTDVFRDVDRRIINRWWAGISEDDRADVERLCDQRLDDCFFGVVADERDHVVPKVRGGRFVPSDDSSWGLDEWGQGYFDHLMAHPELVLVYDPALQTFHRGCVRHSTALNCWSQQAIPAKFTCPFESTECLMHPLRGRAVKRLPAKI